MGIKSELKIKKCDQNSNSDSFHFVFSYIAFYLSVLFVTLLILFFTCAKEHDIITNISFEKDILKLNFEYKFKFKHPLLKNLDCPPQITQSLPNNIIKRNLDDLFDKTVKVEQKNVSLFDAEGSELVDLNKVPLYRF